MSPEQLSGYLLGFGLGVIWTIMGFWVYWRYRKRTMVERALERLFDYRAAPWWEQQGRQDA